MIRQIIRAGERPIRLKYGIRKTRSQLTIIKKQRTKNQYGGISEHDYKTHKGVLEKI
jgi:hypothetical protein